MDFFKALDSDGTIPAGSTFNKKHIAVLTIEEDPLSGAFLGWYIMATLVDIPGEAWAIVDSPGAPYASQSEAQMALDLLAW